MGIAPHIAALRAKVGHDLLLLPSVCILPLDDDGRVLLVRQAEFGTYGTCGGAVDPDESPQEAAKREAREEINAEVELTGIAAVQGGPEFRITYPNGDQCAYVHTMFWARIVGDAPTPDHDEIDGLRWFTREELVAEQHLLGDFAKASLRGIGWL